MRQETRDGKEEEESWIVLFSALIISTSPQLSAGKAIIFSLKVCQLNIRDVRGGEVLRPMGREFMG